LELRQLQYLLAIYEEGSLTRAARRLNVVQPALSQQLRKLEQEVGHLFFTRNPKGMIPTQVGDEAYLLFSNIVRNLEDAFQTLSNENDQVRGTVSIGAVSSVAHNALGETLQKFSIKYPDVQIKATGGYTTELREQLRMSRVDLVIINVPPLLKDPRLVDIVQEDFCLIAAPNTQLDIKGKISLHEVAKLKLVVPSERHGLRMIIERAASEQGVVLRSAMEFDEMKLIEDFVRGTDYFTILPPITVNRALRDGHLKAYPIKPGISRRLVYETSPGRPLSTAAQLLIDEIREDMIEFSYSLEKLNSAGKWPT